VTIAQDVGAKVRGLRFRNRWTLDKLAANIGIGTEALRQREYGKRDFTLDELAKIGDIFGTDWRSLVPNKSANTDL